MKNKKRKIEVLVLSDIHLGTYGCHAKELLQYLKSVNPKTVILNGDIIDIWQFSKHYWPKSHMKVVKHLIGWLSEKKKIYYVPGNHDELFRKFVDFKIDNFIIKNKVVLELDGKKAWFFHGDAFDITMKHSRWLAKLGAVGYDILILINRLINYISIFLGKGKISLSKKIKNSVKSAVNFIDNFEQTVTNIAIENKFNYVVCGHIHQPIIKNVHTKNGKVTYLNSGDWIENLTSLEYINKHWSLYQYQAEDYQKESLTESIEPLDLIDQSSKEIFLRLMADINLKS
ncbi:MAG: UDP-2,3-diacylglucosamine hydrolase [Flavobacteriales bacterium CG_4_9_14_0_2_um_filter_35_242]|nr:UDP-2,3-diacylglucosamine diphosphatase [Zetaproteobacteria bacterium]NDK17777.1 UDP-2,3-diacylglucosamine diphosphatase [Flavobacteriales bacterium]OIO12532.1 MAG: UDP-2,3-diacylglucosamine hydrolase [Flavobacteriaceae bacterium CG1_02_35_72]PIR14832.1 MAG: UDP-2,3-diacylglucosamine hydrolase [Flavobacteriales bacterium CG11_big_fil_rev_8_21_14_0_20_35_7]PIV18271.1 MAG: UDP-2,3-diacylglucosamine hydrolase [Flavobacteriales bacterium CG03_land_8_20_14_0_80_35_15]PIX07201.1 MAG: UDP-2,3-diac